MSLVSSGRAGEPRGCVLGRADSSTIGDSLRPCLAGTQHAPRTKRIMKGALSREHADDLADGVGGACEGGPLGLVEVDLEDLLDAGAPELRRDAHVEPVDAVLALE